MDMAACAQSRLRTESRIVKMPHIARILLNFIVES